MFHRIKNSAAISGIFLAALLLGVASTGCARYDADNSLSALLLSRLLSGTTTPPAPTPGGGSPGVTVTESGGSTDVCEAGVGDSYTIVLNSQPTANVNITITSGAANVTVNGSSSANLTFTTSSWSTPQTISVAATSDGFSQLVISRSISHSSASSDSNYNGIIITNVTAHVTDWQNRRKITIDNSAQNENLSNFPVLVILQDGINIDYSKTKGGGDDIRFVDSDGVTELDFEIEKWKSAGGISSIWVKVPQIDALSSSDYFYIYYNNSGASNGQNATLVWDTNYKMVLHLNGAFSDSTSLNNDGTFGGGVSTVSGQIANAINFDGTSGYVTVPTNGWAGNTGTVEAWSYANSDPALGSNRFVFSYVDDAGTGTNTRIYLLDRNESSQIHYWIGIGDCFTSGSCGDSGANFPNTAWQHLTLTWDGTTSTFKTYINGTPANSGTYDPTNLPALYSFSANATLGRFDLSASEFFNGIIDEVRVSSSVRSADWTAAQYKSMTDSYLSYGTEESL